MGEPSRGLWQLQPPQPFTRPAPPTPAEQLDAAMRYMQARYAPLAAAYLRATEQLAEQLGAQLAALGQAMADALALASADGCRGVRAERGDPTGDPPIGGPGG